MIWNDQCGSPSNELPKATERPRRTKQCLSEAEILGEATDLRSNDLESPCRISDASILHDLRVIIEYVLVQRPRRHKNHIDSTVK